MKYLEFIDLNLFAPCAGTFSFLIANFSVGWVKPLPCSQTTISTRRSCKSRKPIGGKACSLEARSITSRPDNVVRNSQTGRNYRQNYVSHLVNGPSGQRGSTSRGKDIVSRRAENINLKLKEKNPVPEENFIWELQFTFHWKRHLLLHTQPKSEFISNSCNALMRDLRRCVSGLVFRFIEPLNGEQDLNSYLG